MEKRRVKIIRNSAEDRMRERQSVSDFVMTRVQADKKAPPMPVAEMFKQYKKWRKDFGLVPTVLDIGGFGRMLPKSLDRKVVWLDPRTCARCVIGVKVG